MDAEMSENQSDHLGKRGAGEPTGNPGSKRRRSEGPQAALHDLLGEGQCELVSSRNGQEFEVEDARKLRRLLEQKLTLNAELRKHFLAGLEELLQDGDVLHAALRPMTVTGTAAAITGDSFVRVLLNVAPLQNEVATLLLERLPEFCDATSEEERVVPQLLLGQFRWLDHVVDAHRLAGKVLEVLPVCPKELQRDAITFLPEIAPEEDYEEVLCCLEHMMEDDSMFILPVIEAVSNLSLTPGQQGEVVDMMLRRFQAAEAEDLPAVVRFLLQHATIATAKTVVGTLRDSLHFAAMSDPRLAVPDSKQKGKVGGSAENLEHQMLDSIKQGMQLNLLAADALVKEIRGLTDPQQHKALDFWVLLLLCTLGAERRKAAETMLRKKLGDGHADAAWMERAIAGHEKAMAAFFPTLLALAQQLVRAPAEEVCSAGVALFVSLFSHFTDAYNQQEVLRALHSHLGAHVTAEVDAALEVLARLAKAHTAGLMRYAAFLTNILDYLDGYTVAQTHQVFAVFSELVAGTCQQQDESGSGGERSRMEDELFIFLRKQLSGAAAAHRRVGIVGVVALVQRLGSGLSEGTEDESAIGKRYGEAMAMLKTSFSECQRSPDSFAFLCDELAKSIEQQRLSRKLMMDLSNSLQTMFEESFITDLEPGGKPGGRAACVQVGGTKLQGSGWWNLDGEESPAALSMLPFLADQVTAPPGAAARNPLVYLFSIIRLMATIETTMNGNLAAIDALLGCPLALFPMDLAIPGDFGGAGAEVQRLVLLGVFYALNWYRELVNAFAAQLDLMGNGHPPSANAHLELKLFARLRGICQLEALLDALLAQAPPLFSLPALSNALEEGPGAGAAALLAPPAKKKAPAAKKGGAAKGKGKGKKGVKFEEGAGDDGASKSIGSGGTQAGTTASGTATQVANAAATGELTRLSMDRSKFRSLLLPALSALRVGAGAATGGQSTYAMLAPAGYLLADLHTKLKAVLGKARRPGPFFKGPAKQALPADLSQLTPGQLLEAVRRVLPAMKDHLKTALSVISEQYTDDIMAEADKENVWSNLSNPAATQSTAPQQLDAATFLVDMPGNIAAQGALSPSAAASRVALLSLECIRQILVWPGITDPAHQPTLQAILTAFSIDSRQDEEQQQQQQAEGPDSSVWDAAQLLRGCKRTFSHFVALMPDSERAQGGTPPAFEHCHCLLLILDALMAISKGLVKGLPVTKSTLVAQRKMPKRVSEAALGMLRQEWKDASGGQEGSGWKGRSAALAEVLHLYIAHAPDPRGVIKELASEVLTQVTEVTTGKKNSEPQPDFPSLSGSTVGTWYRVALEELQALWDGTVSQAVAAEKGKEFLADEEMVGGLVDSLVKCCEAFKVLMDIVKYQDKRLAVHINAVKGGGKFLETFFKALPFWAAVFSSHMDACNKMIKDLQKGTKVIQVLCSEGKSRKELPLTAKVPQVKRTVERFLFKMSEALLAADQPGVFWLGNLKHRNLLGQEVPSQMYPEDECASDDERRRQQEEEEEDGEDYETGETQGDEEGDGDE